MQVKRLFPENSNRKEYAFSSVLMLVVFLFCCFPLLRKGIVIGTDDTYHLGRVYSLGESIHNGIFPSQIRPTLCYGYGYGEGFFYPDLFLYIPALLIAVGISTEIVVKVLVSVCFAALLGSMYHCVYRLNENRDSAAICACLYTLGYKIFGQFYLEFAIGSFTASVFLPMVIAGIYCFLRKKTSLLLFFLGCIGCVGSHVITTVFAAIITIIVLVVYIGELLSDHKKMVRLFICTVLLLSVAAAYWMPMLEQFKAIRMKSSVHWAIEGNHIVSLKSMFLERGIGIATVMCIPIIIYLLLVFFNKDAMLFFIMGMICLLLPSCYWFWHLINQIGTLIQFPDRLYQPATVLLLFALGMLWPDKLRMSSEADFNCKEGKSRKKLSENIYGCMISVGVGLVILALISTWWTYYRVLEIGYFSLDQVESGTIACAGAGQEWMPIEVETEDLTDPEISYSSFGNQIHGTKQKADSIYTFYTEENAQWYDVPFIHYVGYQAVDENGTEYVTTGNKENGLLRVVVPDQKVQGIHHVIVSYVGTKLQKMGYCMTISGLICSVFWIRKERKFEE